MKSKLERFLFNHDSQSDVSKNWNVFRDKVICSLIKDYVVKIFEKELIIDLDKNSERSILEKCALSFRELIGMKPYRNLDKVRVLACTIDEEE